MNKYDEAMKLLDEKWSKRIGILVKDKQPRAMHPVQLPRQSVAIGI